MSMSRRLLWLNGIAIIAVAVHHAAAFSLQAMFDWTDRYSAVTVPNYDQLGSTAYYVLMVLRLLLTFAGPAFFFISGYFVGIVAKGSQSTVSWSIVSSRIKLLLIPFVIWTAVRYLVLRDLPNSVGDILTPYHWIPLLIQFYLLSPFIVTLAKRNWKLLLLAIAIIGWSVSFLAYLAAFGNAPAQELQESLPNWFFLFNLPFWFPLGAVVGLHLMLFKPWLVRYRWHLLVATIVMAILVIVEYSVVDQLSGPAWLGPGFSGFTKLPYSLFLILSYLGFEKSRMPLADEVSQVGTKSLGIYLGNIPSVYVAAVLMYRLTPMILGYQLLYLAILTLVGLGTPLLLMEAVRRSPMRHRYRVLFG
jgi:peptidoglycan/LPS O-acetylase OafA/YrhL